MSNPSSSCEEEKVDHFLLATQITQLCILPLSLKAAVELDVLGIISRSGLDSRLTPSEIAAQMPGNRNPDASVMLDRMLRLLATHGIVSSLVDQISDGRFKRRYGLTPVGKFFVPNESGVSLGPFLALVEDDVVRASWSKFKDAVLGGGIAFNMFHGVHAFEYPGLDARYNRVFNNAMFNYTTIIMKSMLEKYTNGFEGIEVLVDVGGGLGHTLHAITSKYPSIKGINFDLPHVVCNASSYYGVEHIGGDMFESIPKGDAIFMKWIIHDWDDEHCVKLLKNCYKAIPKDGKVIVMESIVSEEAETTVEAKAISQMDVYMMNKNPGGKERTLNELLTLVTTSGFANVKIICRVSHFCVIEFYK